MKYLLIACRSFSIMSTIKKKKSLKQKEYELEEDIKFERIMKFLGWIFLIVLFIYLGGWFLLDYLLDIMNFELAAPAFAFIVFNGVNAAFSFGFSSMIKSNREKKKSLLFDWLIAELLLCIFAIFSVAAYQW